MLDDVRFILRDVLGETETYDDVLAGAAELCRDVIAPLNAPGDLRGRRLARRARADAGRLQEAFRPSPTAAGSARGPTRSTAVPASPTSSAPSLEELLCAANLVLHLPGLTSSAYRAVALHGDAEQRARLLPPLARGTSPARCA